MKIKPIFSLFLCFIVTAAAFVCAPCLNAEISASAETENVLFGDIDSNGVINANDALLALQQAVDKTNLSEKQRSLADVDCSDTVNATDALQILQFSLEKITSYLYTGINGRTITVATRNINKYTGQSAAAAEYRAAINGIEKKYGMQVKLVEMSEEEISSAISSGTRTFDIVDTNLVEGRNLARRNRVKDISGSAFFDNTFSSGMTGSFTLGTGVYGVASKAMSTNAHGLMMNMDLLKRYAPVSAEKLSVQFENKQWTWEALRALLDEYASNAPENSKIMLSNTNIIGQVIVSNAGYEVDFFPDGTGAASSICSPEGIAAMTYLKSLKTDGLWYYDADVNALYSFFKSGKSPIFAYFLNAASWSSRSGYNFELTAMPFPIGPEKEDYVMSSFNGMAYCIPSSSKKTVNAEMLFLKELMAMDEGLANAVCSDAAACGYNELGVSVYRWSTANTTRDFSSGPFTSAVGGPVDSSVINPTRDPAKVLPSIEKLVQKEVDNYYGKFYAEKN